MKYYLDRGNGKYSDAADYPEEPTQTNNGTWIQGEPQGLTPYVEINFSEQLENSFLALLPNHIGQSYLIDSVIADVMSAKRNVEDANEIDPSGELAKAVIRNLSLPTEMQADQAAILNMFP